MKITINGEAAEVPDGTTVAQLLAQRGLADKPAAVEVNKMLIPKPDQKRAELEDGDAVEIVTLVGGG